MVAIYRTAVLFGIFEGLNDLKFIVAFDPNGVRPIPFRAISPPNDALNGMNAMNINGAQTMNNMEHHQMNSNLFHPMGSGNGYDFDGNQHGNHVGNHHGNDFNDHQRERRDHRDQMEEDRFDRDRFMNDHRGKQQQSRSKKRLKGKNKRKGGKRDGDRDRGGNAQRDRGGQGRNARNSRNARDSQKNSNSRNHQGSGRGGRDAPSVGLSKVSLYGDGDAKRQLMGYIDDYLVSAVFNGGPQIKREAISDIVGVKCKDLRAWSSIINETLRDRRTEEVEQFVFLLVKLFKVRALDNKDNMFQDKVVKYLALECDDSSAVCPQFAERVALLLASLGMERCCPLDGLFRFFKKTHREYSEWNQKRKNKMYEKVKESAVQTMQRFGASKKDIQKMRKM